MRAARTARFLLPVGGLRRGSGGWCLPVARVFVCLFAPGGRRQPPPVAQAARWLIVVVVAVALVLELSIRVTFCGSSIR